MKDDGVGMMLLLVRWWDNELASKLGPKIDKWAVLLGSEESKKSPKIWKHQPDPQPILEPRLSQTQKLLLYCSLSNLGAQYIIKYINISILQLACNFSGAIIYILTSRQSICKIRPFSADNSIFRVFHFVTWCYQRKNDDVIVKI